MPNCPTLPSRLSALGLATRGVAGVLCVFGLIALFAVAKPAPVAASPQQAPNSRVVLDLPSSYTPSPLFSGFQDDARGVSFVILEAPAAEYDKMAQGFTAAEFAKRGITDASRRSFSAPTRTSSCAHARNRQPDLPEFFVLFRTTDQTVLVSSNVPARAVDDGSVKPTEIESVLATAKTTEQPAVHDLFSLSLSRALQGGGHAGRHQQGLYARRAPGARARRRDALGVHGGALARQAAGRSIRRSSGGAAGEPAGL